MHIIFNSREQWREKAFALNLPLKCKRLGNSIPDQFFFKAKLAVSSGKCVWINRMDSAGLV